MGSWNRGSRYFFSASRIRSKSSFESKAITICPLSFAFTLNLDLDRQALTQFILESLDVSGLLDGLASGRRLRFGSLFTPLLLHQQLECVDRVVLHDRFLAQSRPAAPVRRRP